VAGADNQQERLDGYLRCPESSETARRTEAIDL
jgi:hypothetical protein